MKRPAATSRFSESATWTRTSVLPAKSPDDAADPPDMIRVVTSRTPRRVARIAGSRPETTPTVRQRAIEKASTQPLSPSVSSIGSMIPISR